MGSQVLHSSATRRRYRIRFCRRTFWAGAVAGETAVEVPAETSTGAVAGGPGPFSRGPWGENDPVEIVDLAIKNGDLPLKGIKLYIWHHMTICNEFSIVICSVHKWGICYGRFSMWPFSMFNDHFRVQKTKALAALASRGWVRWESHRPFQYGDLQLPFFLVARLGNNILSCYPAIMFGVQTIFVVSFQENGLNISYNI